MTTRASSYLRDRQQSPYDTIPVLIDWPAVPFGDAEALVQGDLGWN